MIRSKLSAEGIPDPELPDLTGLNEPPDVVPL
jgi:hypothetical protein